MASAADRPVSKAVGAPVPCGLCNRSEPEQVKRLHGPILHDRDTQWSHRCRSPLWYVHPPQRPWSVPVLPQLMYGLPLSTRDGPDLPVDPRRIAATIPSHSSHGKRFAAEGVGQQVLQGLHPAPPTFLRRLHDAHLEAAHVAIVLVPVDLIPGIFTVGGRTRRQNGLDRPSAIPRTSSRHLLCLLCRLARLSRDEKPCGSPLAFARGDVALRLNPYPAHYRPALRLFRNPLPAAPSARLAARFPFREGYGLTAFRTCTLMG